MPTPKQVRHHYKNCRKLFYKLKKALNEAHDLGVINYQERKNAEGNYRPTLPSVCETIWEAEDRFEGATRDQLANAMKAELMKEVRGIY